MSARTESSQRGHADTPKTGPLSVQDVLALPAFVDLATAGQAIGKGRSTTFDLVRKGQFPIPVLRVGRRRGCTLAALCAYLGIPLTP